MTVRLTNLPKKTAKEGEVDEDEFDLEDSSG